MIVKKRVLISKVFIPILLVLAIVVSFMGQATPVLACYINSVTTNPATDVTPVSAKLNGSVDVAHSSDITVCSFEYGLTNSYGLTTSGVSKTGDKEFSFNISNLRPNTLYHFRAKAVESPQYISYGIDRTFTTLATYNIVASAGAHGSIAPSGSISVNTGSDQTFNITPDLGRHIVSLVVDGAMVGVDNTYTFYDVNDNHTIAASFAIDTFSFSFESNGGSTVAPQIVKYDDKAIRPADPIKTGNTFGGWYSDTGLETAYDFDTLVTSNITLYAKWNTEADCMVTFDSNGGSTVAPQIVKYNDKAIRPADPIKTGNTFGGWYSDAGLETAYNFDTLVTSDITLYAKWTNATYTITATAGSNGSISPEGEVEVEFGANQEFTVSVAPVYHVASLLVDGAAASLSEGKYSFTNVTANHTIDVTFAIDNFTLTYTAGTHGSIKGTSPQIVSYGDNGTEVIAIPTTGYRFVKWSDGVNTASRTELNVTKDITVTASFAIKNGGGDDGGYQGGGEGGDGGGGGVSTIPAGTIAEVVPEIDYFTVDFQGRITRAPVSSEGAILNSIFAPSPDGAHLFTMPQGTITLDKASNIVKLITIRETQMPPITETQVSLGLAYDFEPSGVTFSQPVVITLEYDLNQVPNKIESIGLAYYSESGWIGLAGLPGTIAEAGKASAPVQHFSTYAVIANKLPASFTASNLVIKPSENTYWQGLPFVIVKGDKAEISVEVLNNGGVNGDYTGVLKLNDKAFSQQVITLFPDQNGKLVFKATNLKPSSYRVEIGGLTSTLNSTYWINWWLLSGLILALAAVIWLIIFFATRKKKLAVKK